VKVSGLVAVAAQFLAGRTTNKYLAVPGPYSGADVGSISFYVAPGGKSMLNVSVPTTALSCTPGGGVIDDHFEILQVALAPNGSLSAATSQSGVLSGITVKFTYTIAGRFQAATKTSAASAAGRWRENVVFSSGSVTSCTSNNQTWTATLYREPAQKKILVKPGSYSGADVGSINFSVSPSAKSMLNVSVPTTALVCTPGGGVIDDHFEMLQVAIGANGSFSARTSQTGVLSGISAKFTYTLEGSFEGPTPAGAATVAGTWREDVVFASGTTKMCTSNNQFWIATQT